MKGGKPRLRAAAVLVAAGEGKRLGADVPKAWVTLAGRPLFMHSVSAFSRLAWVGRIVLVVGKSHVSRARRVLEAAGLEKRVKVVPGGPRRQDSAANGVRALSPRRGGVLLIHDCARPLVDLRAARETAAAAMESGAALAALPVRDTVKYESQGGFVTRTVPRKGLWLAQTPQAMHARFVPAWLDAARKREFTDDVQPLELMGAKVRLVPGNLKMMKVTLPEDLSAVREIVRSAGLRAGLGFDMHRLVSGRPLILGGVRIPFGKGLEGHSDADIVCHALCDAMLGAVNKGDMGSFFGVRRMETRGAPSTGFLKAVAERLRQEGWRLGNADVTVISQAPRLRPYRGKMASNLASLTGVNAENISIKATTAKKMGVIGEGAAMACLAIVSVLKDS